MSADLAAPTGAGGRAAPGEARAAVAAPPDRAGAPRRVAVGLVLLFFLFPIVYLALVSVKPQPEMLSGRLLPSRFAWENWSGAYAAAPVLLYLRNSVVVAVLSAGLTMLLAVPATYAMVRHGTGGKALSTLLLSTYMAPPVVAVLPLFYLLKWLGLIDTLPGLALLNGLAAVPVAVWLLDSFVRGVPREIEEAAAVDGAGQLETLWRIVLPLIAPGIAAAAIICMILAYNEFLFAVVTTYRPETQTLPVGTALFQGDRLVRFGQMAAASLTGMVPVYAVALIFQRWMIEGLTSGAVK